MRHADGTCHDLQLCGGTDPDQPRCSWNQTRHCQSGCSRRPLFPSGRGSPDDFRRPHSSDGVSVRKWNVHPLQPCRRAFELSCDASAETHQGL